MQIKEQDNISDAQYILVYTVLNYFPQYYTPPHSAGILVYMVLKYFPQFYTHPPLCMYFSLHGTKILSTILHPPPTWQVF